MDFSVGKAWSYCEYSGEKISYDSNKDRCEGFNGTVCDFESFSADVNRMECHLGIQSYSNSFHWTNQTCSTQAKSKFLVSLILISHWAVTSE